MATLRHFEALVPCRSTLSWTVGCTRR